MKVKEIVKKFLEDNGYDGLTSGECGCKVEDLMPCDGCMGCGQEDCQAGHLTDCNPETCPADGKCDWHIEVKT